MIKDNGAEASAYQRRVIGNGFFFDLVRVGQASATLFGSPLGIAMEPKLSRM